MKYGAKESNSTEAMGLTFFIAGLALFVAGWAYGESIIQVIAMLLGLVGFFGGFAVLAMARSGKPLMNRS
jgi:multisubunit Na+/H+ antiporter MnhF subunit